MRFLSFYLLQFICLASLISLPVTATEVSHFQEDGIPELPFDTDELDNGDFVWAPLPSSGPTLGTGGTLGAAWIYKTDEASKPSMTGFGVMATSNGTWGGGAVQEHNFNEDRYRLSLSGGYARVRYQFFGTSNETGVSLPIRLEGTAVIPSALVRVRDALFVGLRYRYFSAKTKIGSEAPQLPLDFPSIPDVELDADAPLIGFQALYDTRDNAFNPKSGSMVSLAFELGRNWLGNDFSYERLTVNGAHYFPLSDDGRHVLAVGIYACRVWGDAPFFDLCLFGSDSFLRGYDVGRFIDRAMVASQVEYRWRLWERFGIVSFFGAGGIGRSMGSLKNGRVSGGVGIRYAVSTRFDVNVGIDYAYGEDGDAIYVRVGEAF